MCGPGLASIVSVPESEIDSLKVCIIFFVLVYPVSIFVSKRPLSSQCSAPKCVDSYLLINNCFSTQYGNRPRILFSGLSLNYNDAG